MINRRQALKLISGAGVSIYLSQHLGSAVWGASSNALHEISPIDRTIPDSAPRIWFSDYPDRAHKILWNKESHIASLGSKTPTPKERVPLVIIGGGISGLVAGYLLRKHKPIIFEQAPNFGGNSKGQSWRGIDYSIGAAYFIEPEAGSEIAKLLGELGLDKTWNSKSEEDPIAINGTIFNEFWGGQTVIGDLQAKNQIRKLSEYFKKVNEGEEIIYPEIPIIDPSITDYIKKLDNENFKEHLERIVGGKLVGQVATVIEQYCWSAFAASASEVSAASGLNFYASEFGSIAVLPGGNSAVAERMLERLAADIPLSNLRNNSLVYDVCVVEDGVIVSYQDAQGQDRAVHAKSVVMSCPKFVVGKVLRDIEPERVEAIKRIRYRSYLVANLCIEGGGSAPFYDLYLLGDGKINPAGVKEAAEDRKVTDVICADYAKSVSGNSVLTLYRALPYDGARADLLANDSYSRYRLQFEQQINDSILPLLKIDSGRVRDLRIARWGHPLPVAAPGLIANGVTDILRSPFRKRVFFIEQDNWALPAFETAVTEAQIWCPQVTDFLAK